MSPSGVQDLRPREGAVFRAFCMRNVSCSHALHALRISYIIFFEKLRFLRMKTKGSFVYLMRGRK